MEVGGIEVADEDMFFVDERLISPGTGDGAQGYAHANFAVWATADRFASARRETHGHWEELDFYPKTRVNFRPEHSYPELEQRWTAAEECLKELDGGTGTGSRS